MTHPTPPAAAGFYWAKWRIAEEGSTTFISENTTPDIGWEVVEVHENGPDELRASLAGESLSQPLENFVWWPERLVPPPDPKAKSLPPCKQCDGCGWVGGTKQTPKQTCPRCNGNMRAKP